MSRDNIRRMHFFCYGRVQGVGFRYRACRAARLLDLTGYVRNLDDGSVELEIQGEAYCLSQFWVKLIEHSFIDIERKEAKEIEVNPNEWGFSVRDYY